MDSCGFLPPVFHHTLDEANLAELSDQIGAGEYSTARTVYVRNSHVDYGLGGLVFQLMAKELMRATGKAPLFIDATKLWDRESLAPLWDLARPVFVEDFFVHYAQNNVGASEEDRKRAEKWYRYRWSKNFPTWVFGHHTAPGSTTQKAWYSSEFLGWLKNNAVVISTGI